MSVGGNLDSTKLQGVIWRLFKEHAQQQEGKHVLTPAFSSSSRNFSSIFVIQKDFEVRPVVVDCLSDTVHVLVSEVQSNVMRKSFEYLLVEF